MFKTKIKYFIINLGIAGASTLVLLIILEILLRIFGHQDIYTVSAYPKKMFDSKNVIGLRPDFQGEFKSSEIKGSIKINSKGLRDIERPYEKPIGGCRILGMGDSFTFGHGVEIEESFLNILEKNLKQTHGNIEIIKAGVPATGPLQYLTLLKNEGLKYNPDIVMVHFFVGNDLEGIPMQIKETGDSTNNVTFAEKEDIQSTKTWLRRNVHLYSFAVDRLKSNPTIRRILKENNIATGMIGSYIIDILKKDYTEDYKFRWKKLEEILEEMKAVNPNIFVIIIPTREQIEESRLKQAVVQLNYDINDIDRLHPNKKLLEICNRLQIGLIDITPDFTASFESDGKALYFDIDTHFNKAGHISASNSLYKRIVKGLTDNSLPLKLCHNEFTIR